MLVLRIFFNVCARQYLLCRLSCRRADKLLSVGWRTPQSSLFGAMVPDMNLNDPAKHRRACVRQDYSS